MNYMQCLAVAMSTLLLSEFTPIVSTRVILLLRNIEANKYLYPGRMLTIIAR